ncbi:hypothetical protein QUF54_01800 [Candidatus Marithioploca araucensis]|uniref:Uncharacterized protein n=1 Tax=Candidatus Marithioploca araucensis TaxID=70273 RepID=A0ABT7VQY2_9GAMM|nr:hypothetical protein [Candidatus Marithioploca araucensis]
MARRKNAPIVLPPLPGSPVLIDPRCENPLDYMALDLLGTFWFVPIADEGTQNYQRAEYTIDILRLNYRDVLVEARHNAFDSYKARLYEYQNRKTNGADRNELNRLIKSLKKMHHPTVWAEMKRQYTSHDELKRLFQNIPEALSWCFHVE